MEPTIQQPIQPVNNNQPKSPNKLALSVLALLALVVVAVAGYFYYELQKSTTNVISHTDLTKSIPDNSTKDLPLGQVPTDLPKELILDPNAIIIHSMIGLTPTGLQQSTIVYSTTMSLGDIENGFLKFLTNKDNFWLPDSPLVFTSNAPKPTTQKPGQKVPTIDQSKYQYAFSGTAQKTGNKLKILISKDPQSTDIDKAPWQVSVTILTKTN